MMLDKIKKEFDYLYEVLSSERETYIWVINYVQDNILNILIESGYQLNRDERKALGSRIRHLEETMQGWDLERSPIPPVMVQELAALRRVSLRENLTEEILDAKRMARERMDKAKNNT